MSAWILSRHAIPAFAGKSCAAQRLLSSLLRVTLLVHVLLPTNSAAQSGNEPTVVEPVVLYRRMDGQLPSFSVSVYPDKVMFFVGMRDSRTIGTRRFTISDEQYQTLLRSLKDLYFSAMNERYISKIGVLTD
jgi:hypothetical protein